MKTGRLRALGLVPVLALTVAVTGGCSSGGGSPAATSPAGHATTAAPASGAAVATITIKDFGYGAPITVSPGAMVAVTNMDSARHTVTANEGSAFDVDVQGNGGTGTFTAPMQPGTYAYHCTFHPGMLGTLTVK